MARARSCLAAVALAEALQITPAIAEVATGPCPTVMDPNNAPSTDPRIEHLIIDGAHVNVLLPPRYPARPRCSRW